MNEEQFLSKYNDVIDIKDLVITIWKGKKIILAITLIFAILVALFTKFLIEPVFDTKVDLVINMPASVDTKYGAYNMMMNTNDQYLQLIYSNSVIQQTLVDLSYDMSKHSIEKFNKNISIEADDTKPNSFTIIVSSDSADESLRIANTLYKNYISFLDVYIKNSAVEYFSNQYTVELQKNNVSLETYKNILKQNEELLKQIPRTINPKEVLADSDVKTLDYVVLENVVNDNYTKVELDIISNKQTITSIENNINIYNTYLTELNNIQNNISDTAYTSSFCNVVKTSIYLPSQPVKPMHKTSPSTVKNTVIGAVIGGMISVIYVLIKKYWFTEVK